MLKKLKMGNTHHVVSGNVLDNIQPVEIIQLKNDSKYLKEGINYFWKCWGISENYGFYEDCIQHSTNDASDLPKFYLAVEDGKILGSYALLRNDVISRQDIMPWFACLFVEEERRGEGIADQLLAHGMKEARDKGYSNLYLCTDLVGFYEKKGWQYFAGAYNVQGQPMKIYSRKLDPIK